MIVIPDAVLFPTIVMHTVTYDMGFHMLCNPIHVSLKNGLMNERLECVGHLCGAWEGVMGKVRRAGAVCMPFPDPITCPSSHSL